MSISIHHGYISNLDLYRLLKKFKPLIPQFQKLKKELYGKYLITESCIELDRLIHQGKVADTSGARDFLNKVHERNEKTVKDTVAVGIREPGLDFTASCSLFPVHKKKTLILFYAEDKAIKEFWESLPFIDEYYYFNNSDRPKEISRSQWIERRDNWDKAWGHGAAADSSYTFRFNDERLPWPSWIENINQHLPSNERRANHLLHDDFMELTLKLLIGDKEFNFDLYNKARDLWIEYKETPDYQQALKNMIATLHPISFEYRHEEPIDIELNKLP
jgi:hypothetical protein